MSEFIGPNPAGTDALSRAIYNAPPAIDPATMPRQVLSMRQMLYATTVFILVAATAPYIADYFY